MPGWSALPEHGAGSSPRYFSQGKRILLAPDRDTDALRTLLTDPDKIACKGRQILKTDATTTLWLAPMDGEQWVIKRYNTRGPWHALKRALHRTRAANCWRMAHTYLACGIATAPPVALIEQRHGGFAGRSWFVNAFVEGTLLSDLLRERRDLGGLETVTDGVVEIFAALQANRLSHGDMKATNILLVDGVPLLLDLDAARLHHSGWAHRRALARDRRRFLRNWDRQPEIRRMFAARLDALQL